MGYAMVTAPEFARGGWALPLGADWVRWGTHHKKRQEESLPRDVNAHLMVLALNREEESLSFHIQLPATISPLHEISVG